MTEKNMTDSTNIQREEEEKKNANFWPLILVATVLVIAFLKLAKIIVLPIVISIFLSFLLIPVIHWLRQHRVPAVLSSFLSLGLVFLVIVFVISLFVVSLRSLSASLPTYETRLMLLLSNAIEYINSFGFDIQAQDLMKTLDVKALMGVAGKGVGFVLGFGMDLLKYGLMIFFVTLFMMIESTRIGEKAVRAFGQGDLIGDSTKRIAMEIQRYIMFKTLISLATGILAWAFLSIVGVDFPLVWGLITFLLNFIPSVGSIIATFPPLFMALIQFDSPIKYAVITLIGLGGIQLAIGNYLDPKIMGENLNLSTLVIFISMIFWGWVWGPIGMLIAVPIAVALKVMMQHHPRTKPIAMMMEG